MRNIKINFLIRVELWRNFPDSQKRSSDNTLLQYSNNHYKIRDRMNNTAFLKPSNSAFHNIDNIFFFTNDILLFWMKSEY